MGRIIKTLSDYTKGGVMEDNLNYIIRNTPEQKEEKKDSCNLCNYFGVVYAFDKTWCKKCYDEMKARNNYG